MDASIENSKKLDKVIRLLEGEGEGENKTPGLMERVSAVERILYGQDKLGGLVVEVAKIRKITSWISHTATAAISLATGLGVSWIVKHL